MMRGVWCDGQAVQLRRNLPTPTPRPGEVLLEVRAAGICDTDLQLARGYMSFQGVLGHEFVGVTPDGRRVTSEINHACHACEICRAGRPRHCPHRTVLGILGHDGAMADRVAVPERGLHEIPETIRDEEAIFIEPLAAAIHWVEQVEIRACDRLAVVGDGKLGLLCAWVARGTGAEVHLVGKHPEKLALAGPRVTTHEFAEIAELRGAFDIVIEASGSESGLTTAMGLARPCGTVVLKTTVVGRHTLNLAPIVIDEIKLIGSRCGPFEPAIALLEHGAIDVKPLIQAVYPLDDAEEAFRVAGSKGARKIVLRVGESKVI